MFQSSDTFFFDAQHLDRLALSHRANYSRAAPFPHVVIDDFLPQGVARKLVKHYPKPDHECWLDWKTRDTTHQPRKLGIGSAERLASVHPFIRSVLLALNSHEFVSFIESLTGTSGLIPDQEFIGAGLHQILPGGHLDIHADFNRLSSRQLYRRTNAIIYLNERWNASYGGNLELWRDENSGPAVTVAPIFNRLVVFNTDKRSFHGHPHPLTSPEGITRKSLAIYHYSVTPWPGQEEENGTTWSTHGGL